MRELGQRATNDSKVCGGVMRVAPVGLWAAYHALEPRETFALGKELAWLTHGHPSGYLTGGVLAVLVQRLIEGSSLEEALILSLALLATNKVTRRRETPCNRRVNWQQAQRLIRRRSPP